MTNGGAERARRWGLEPRQLLWKFSDQVRQMRQKRTLNADAALGRRGEDFAHRYLRSAGYMVVARNYRPGGDSEIDIVARRGELLVFVEVKARTSAAFGSPERAIGPEKEKHIVRAAHSYATRAGIDWNRLRFDTISVVFTDPPSVVHQIDAFFHGRSN
jgi:putative endonuclease